MNTLTKNRILQEGDEYSSNGKWKPVPKTDFGLQIQFTDYKEVRRPSEKPAKNLGSGEALPSMPAAKAGRVESRPQSPPISPRQEAPYDASPVAAESEKSPVPTHSGAGGTPAGTKADETARLAHAVSHLPTVVSKKAHSEERAEIETAIKAIKKERPVLLIAGGTSVPVKANGTAAVGWKDTEPHCIWIGRNGTFKCRGLKLRRHYSDVIRIVPVGKRGTARNAVIEFPVSAIPDVIRALDHLTKKTPK